MQYPELDGITRKWMLEEFEKEEASGNPYRSKWLSSAGRDAFAAEMEKAIVSGNEVSLGDALNVKAYWDLHHYTANGTVSSLPRETWKTVARNEFNVWYTRGFARRLLEEGVENCVIYRAEIADVPRCVCSMSEGKIVPVRKVYGGHRAKYHPAPGNPGAFSIPSGQNCQHSIRRPDKCLDSCSEPTRPLSEYSFLPTLHMTPLASYLETQVYGDLLICFVPQCR